MAKIIRLSESQLDGIIKKVLNEQSSQYVDYRRNRVRQNLSPNNNPLQNTTTSKFVSGSNIEADAVKKPLDSLNHEKTKFKSHFENIPKITPRNISEPEIKQKTSTQNNIYTDFDRIYDYWLNNNNLWFARKKTNPDGKWVNISHIPSAVDKLNRKYKTKGRIIGVNNTSQKPSNNQIKI